MPAQVLTSWALLIYEELIKCGCDARAIFKQAGLKPERLADANARYSISAMQKLWSLAIETSGEVHEKDIAASLGVSVRTMQRQLAKDKQSFKQLFDAIRQQLAEQHLANSQLSLNGITFLLGFANQANFTRAFKRWHGMTPSSYRQQHLRLIA